MLPELPSPPLVRSHTTGTIVTGAIATVCTLLTATTVYQHEHSGLRQALDERKRRTVGDSSGRTLNQPATCGKLGSVSPTSHPGCSQCLLAAMRATGADEASDAEASNMLFRMPQIPNPQSRLCAGATLEMLPRRCFLGPAAAASTASLSPRLPLTGPSMHLRAERRGRPPPSSTLLLSPSTLICHSFPLAFRILLPSSVNLLATLHHSGISTSAHLYPSPPTCIR